MTFFKYVAYLNIPFMLGAFYFIYEPLLTGGSSEEIIENIPTALVLIGFGLSFTSLRDVKKIDKMGRALIERPKLFFFFVYFSLILGFGALTLGLVLIINSSLNQHSLGIGLAALALGFISMVKSIVDQAKDLTDLYK